MIFRACLALVAALATSACGVPLMKLPAGPGSIATDAAEALAQATAACRSITTITAEVGAAGRISDRRLRGRLLAGLSAPASAFLDAPAPFGASIFLFAATENDATLLLPRDRRVLEHGRPREVLEAVTGVPLAPADLRLALTGCTSVSTADDARQIGAEWRVIPGEDELYLRRERAAAPWQLVAVVHRPAGAQPWRAEYRDFVNGLPRSVRLSSVDSNRFDLRLSLSQVETNVALDAATFQLEIPPGYDPITVQELRDAGPLADRSRSNE